VAGSRFGAQGKAKISRKARMPGVCALFSNKIHRKHQKNKAYEVVPLQRLILEKHQREQARIFLRPHTIGRYDKTILEEGNEPTGQNDTQQTRLFEKCQVLKFQVPIPGKSHKHVGKQKQGDGGESFHGNQVLDVAKKFQTLFLNVRDLCSKTSAKLANVTKCVA